MYYVGAYTSCCAAYINVSVATCCNDKLPVVGFLKPFVCLSSSLYADQQAWRLGTNSWSEEIFCTVLWYWRNVSYCYFAIITHKWLLYLLQFYHLVLISDWQKSASAIKTCNFTRWWCNWQLIVKNIVLTILLIYLKG